MLEIEVPGWKSLELAHLLLDVNGTLTLDGALLPGVAERIERLRAVVAVHLLSADTFGRLEAVAGELRVAATRLRQGEPEAEQKAAFAARLGPESVVAVGNGANDVAMLRSSALGIAVLGPEGLSAEALAASDVVVRSVLDGLDLLLHPRRLVATLRR